MSDVFCFPKTVARTRITRLLLLLLMGGIYCGPASAVSDGSDRVCLANGNCYYPIDSGSMFGDGVNGGLRGMSSTSSSNGNATVQEKNVCPVVYQGGELYGLQEYGDALWPVIQINGAPYLQFYSPTGKFPDLDGTKISYGPSDNLSAPYGPKLAGLNLLVVREIIAASARSTIGLSNGKSVTKKEVLALIDTELKLLK